MQCIYDIPTPEIGIPLKLNAPNIKRLNVEFNIIIFHIITQQCNNINEWYKIPQVPNL